MPLTPVTMIEPEANATWYKLLGNLESDNVVMVSIVDQVVGSASIDSRVSSHLIYFGDLFDAGQPGATNTRGALIRHQVSTYVRRNRGDLEILMATVATKPRVRGCYL